MTAYQVPAGQDGLTATVTAADPAVVTWPFAAVVAAVSVRPTGGAARIGFRGSAAPGANGVSTYPAGQTTTIRVQAEATPITMHIAADANITVEIVGYRSTGVLISEPYIGGSGGGGGSAPDATTSTKGVARLLGGSADAPSVPWASVTEKPTIPTGKLADASDVSQTGAAVSAVVTVSEVDGSTPPKPTGYKLVAPESVPAIARAARKGGTDLREFGTGVGVGDAAADTAALQTAWAYITASATSGRVSSTPSDQYDISQSTIILPPGSITYTGSGLTDTGITGFAGRFAIRGAYSGTSEVRLADNSRLIDVTSAPLTRLEFADFQVRGGAGLFRHQRVADNVFGDLAFRRLVLRSYTGCAIEWNTQNNPYVTVEGCTFRGLNTFGTIGIALSGIANGAQILRNHFLTNRIHVKMRRAGNDVYFDGNDFLRFSTDRTNGPCTDLWLVPSADFGGLGAGAGTNLTRSNKLGNENFLSGDYKILIADEDNAGVGNGGSWPVTTADSVGYVEGVTISATVYGAANAVRSPIYSTTPNVYGCDVDILHRGGPSLPAHILEFRTPSSVPASRRLRATNRIAITGSGVNADKLVRPSNARSAGGVGAVTDPGGQFGGVVEAPLPPGGVSWGDYRNIVSGTTGIVGWTNGSGLTKTGATGSYGTSTECVEATFVNGGILQGALSAGTMIPGRRCWVEGLVRQGGSDPMPQIGLRLNDLNSNLVAQWIVEVPLDAGYLRFAPFRFSFIPDTAGGSLTFFVVDAANDLPGAGGTGKIRLERVRAYQSREPVQLQPRPEPLDLTQGFRQQEGVADARQGVATLVAGSVTVSSTAVTSNSRIMLTSQNSISGAIGMLGVIARTVGTGFTIAARDASGTTVTNDTRQVAWALFEPMP